MERSADASRRLVFDLFVPLFLLLLLAFTRVQAVEQRLFDRHHGAQAASVAVDSGEDPGGRIRGPHGGPVVPPWETEEGDDSSVDDVVVSDRHGHRIRFRDELVKSIKENILKSLGRTGTTAAGGGGRRGSTSPGQATVDQGAEEEVSVAQVKKIIVFSDIPVLTASENGTVEFLLRRSSQPFRIDSVDLHLRISAPAPSSGSGHRLRHHRTRPFPSVSVVHVTRPGDPFHVAPVPPPTTGEEEEEEEEPLPIARSSVRVKAAAAAAWQRVPLPSSVVQEVLDSSDPVLRLYYVCDHCEVLPSGTSQPSTHRKRDEAGGSGSYARKRHGHGLPYLTISTYDLAERK